MESQKKLYEGAAAAAAQAVQEQLDSFLKLAAYKSRARFYAKLCSIKSIQEAPSCD